MKPTTVLLMLAVALLGSRPALLAQDEAAAALARQAQEEQLRTLSTRVANLEEANLSLQKKIQELTTELFKLREDVARAANTREVASIQESIRRLEAAVKEVDDKRISDNNKVLAAIESIQDSIKSRPAPPGRSTPPARTGTRSANQEGYHYTIKSGDTLSGLVAALRAEGLKVSMKEVMDANPDVDWRRLQVGSTIFIPKPE
jgi:predicted RNase H-like nuclease (RuvC/YqgF family)